MTYNVNTFPDVGTIKHDRIKHETKQGQIIGISELNKNWAKIPASESYYRRTESWGQRPNTQVAWLYDPEWPSIYQGGGVALTIQGHLAPYVQDKGKDGSGMGRWAWYTLEGRSEIKTAVIQLYRPCRNKHDLGSVFNQQKAWTEKQDPLQAFDKDLLELIDIFRESRFQVMVMGDFNIPLLENKKSKLEQEFEERRIIDPIRGRYGKTNAPNTQYRGSTPIDAIFCSDTLEMIQGGYDPGMPEISDHRLLWMDITLDSLLGVDRGIYQKPQSRNLQTKNKRVTRRFNMAFETQIQNHNLVPKSQEILKIARDKKQLSTQEQAQFEVLDTQRTRAAAHANNRCAKKPSDDADFSPQIQSAIGRVTLWSEIGRRIKKNKQIHKRWLIRMKARWDIQEHIQVLTNIDEVKLEIIKAKDQLKEIKKNAPELRKDFLDMLIQKAEEEGNDQKAKDIRIIRDQERVREVHRRIKISQGKLKGGGVKFVERTRPDGSKETVKDKTQMEKEIIKANEKKLHAADASPLRRGQLNRLLTDSDYDQWERLLAKEIELPPTMEEGTSKWLQEVQHMPERRETLELTEDEYARSWAVQREHTACAPGPLHFGTFKAMQWSPLATTLHTTMANIPILTGYTPKRWNQCVDSMLPKKKDVWLPDKLRLTALMMPDFNHNNKILGRFAMRKAEKHKILAPEQYGSRKKLSAEKHALNKRLVLDILRQQRRPAVLCANDAKSCYDRILHIAAYTALRRTGLTPEAVKSMLEPIRNMQHTIRTAYGDSQQSYGGEKWKRDPSGICQGNGAGPAIWALVSSPLLQMVREAGYGAKLKAAIGDTSFHLAGFAFVDDADTIQTGELNEPIEEVIAKAQRQLQLWEEGIRATGGGIEGTKSDFAVVDFRWEKGTWKHPKMKVDHKLCIPSDTGRRVYLKQLPHTEARRTLGVWQAIDGNEKEQTKQMRDKAEEWSKNVKKGFLSREDITVGIKTSLYPSITYGLMATALNKKQCEEVFRPVRKYALSNMGYNKHIPATIVHGPEKYGGIGIRDIYTIQGTEHIKLLMDEAIGDSQTAKLLKISHTEHQLEIGRPGSIYEHEYDEIEPFLTDTWISNTLEFMAKTGIQIEGDHEELNLWREHDAFLMEDFRLTPGNRLTINDLCAANRCRMYLRATTRADITYGDGTSILKQAWEVKREWNTTSSYKYEWRAEPRPSAKDRERWRHVLQTTYGVNPTFLGGLRELGHWTTQALQYNTSWYDIINDHVYTHNMGAWTRWTHQQKRTRTTAYKPAEIQEHAPQAEVVPATVTRHQRRNILYMHGYVRHQTWAEGQTQTRPDNDRPTPITLMETLQEIPQELHWALEDIHLPDDEGRHIAQKIIESTCEVICDGSLKDLHGTLAGFCKEIKEEWNYVFLNRVPGDDNNQSSFRSELCGILGHVLMIDAIAKTHKVGQGRVTMGCDNEGALWAAFGHKQPTTADSCFDIIRVLRHQLTQSPIHWTYRHVKGHQDKYTSYDELDSWAQANVMADEKATDYWIQKYTLQKKRPRPPRMPGEGWRLTLGTRIITQHIDKAIHNHAYHAIMAKYWIKKGRINNNEQANVDWDLYEATIKITPRTKVQWTHKHFTGFEATNSMLYKIGDRLDDKCPRCDKVEKHHHLLQCQAPEATETYATVSQKQANWLRNTTSEWMTLAVMEQIEAYREDRPVAISTLWPDDIREATRKQERIGPRAFVEGCIHREWEGIQARYLQSTKSKRNPRRWMKELILKIWMISWDLWDSRNGLIHGNKETRQAQIIATLDAQITDMHEFGSQHRFLPRVARIFFQISLEDILKKTEYQKRVWARLGERYLDNDVKRITQHQEAASLREWLIPGSTQERHRTHRQERIRERTRRSDSNNRTGFPNPTAEGSPDAACLD